LVGWIKQRAKLDTKTWPIVESTGAQLGKAGDQLDFE
jgi:hypothetical protein